MANKYKQKNSSKAGEPEYVLVYSTEPEREKRCQKCNKFIASCSCEVIAVKKNVASIKPIVQIEKQGRGGKIVTLLKRLPTDEDFLKDFCAHLKRMLGAGGTYYIEGIEGIIEIQGDRRKGLLDLANAYLLQQSGKAEVSIR